MLKRLTKKEVRPDQREYAERTAHEDTCKFHCKMSPLCGGGPYYVEEWLHCYDIHYVHPEITCN